MSERLVRFCGADCSRCATYAAFQAGDTSGIVNSESQYRCCRLPRDYPEGQDCPIRVCCEAGGLLLCGECAEFEGCDRMSEFYAQPGYDELRNRMLHQARMLERVASRKRAG